MASAAAAPATDAAPAKGGKKKLLLIVGIVVVLLLAGGGGALFMMKKASDKAAAEAAADEDGEGPAVKATVKVDPAKPPAFVPLDPFVVNLADRDADRFAQIGITLEVDDPAFAEKMKPFMPAIRNNILMILAHKTSTELLGREGKEKLAEEIAREAVRPMGIDIDPPEPEAAADEPPKKKKRRAAGPKNPVRAVLFSSFIVQ